MPQFADWDGVVWEFDEQHRISDPSGMGHVFFAVGRRAASRDRSNPSSITNHGLACN